MNYNKTLHNSLFLCFISTVCAVAVDSLSDMQSRYEQVLTLKAIDTPEGIVNTCSWIQTSLKDVSKSIHADEKFLRKHYKKNASAEILIKKLKSLRVFFKKHATICHALEIHRNVQKLYGDLCFKLDEGIDIIEYINTHRSAYSIRDDGHNFLEEFLCQVKYYCKKISQLEDDIHADYVDLKLHNYVYKIELIKLRNFILFDERYRYRKSDYIFL